MLLTKIKKDDFLYGALNVLGGSALTYYAISIGSLPFAVLELVWVLAALGNLLKNGHASKNLPGKIMHNAPSNTLSIKKKATGIKPSKPVERKE